MRFRPFESRALDGAKAFESSFGHQIRTTDYSYNRRYEHIYKFERMVNPGHAVRYTSQSGAADSFGAFGPYTFKGAGDGAFGTSYGQTLPEGYDNLYGRNKVNEWRGVPSARAL
jgi:hypothetical protein